MHVVRVLEDEGAERETRRIVVVRRDNGHAVASLGEEAHLVQRGSACVVIPERAHEEEDALVMRRKERVVRRVPHDELDGARRPRRDVGKSAR